MIARVWIWQQEEKLERTFSHQRSLSSSRFHSQSVLSNCRKILRRIKWGSHQHLKIARDQMQLPWSHLVQKGWPRWCRLGEKTRTSSWNDKIKKRLWKGRNMSQSHIKLCSARFACTPLLQTSSITTTWPTRLITRIVNRSVAFYQVCQSLSQQNQF